MAARVTGSAVASALARRGLTVPARHRLLTLEERPDLERAVERLGSSVWPEFMLHDAVSDRLWEHMADDFPAYQLALADDAGGVIAVGRSLPLVWDGTPADLPRGWDAQFERSIEQHERGMTPNTLGAIMIVGAPERRGEGLGTLMVGAMQEAARAHGLRALIACVRPTLLEQHPYVSIDEYARWTRADGLPFDPWIRIHVRLGGHLTRPEPASMRVSGSLEEWRAWTGMALRESGPCVVPGACAPVEVDLDAGIATYLDPNIWVIHDLA